MKIYNISDHKSRYTSNGFWLFLLIRNKLAATFPILTNSLLEKTLTEHQMPPPPNDGCSGIQGIVIIYFCLFVLVVIERINIVSSFLYGVPSVLKIS